MERFAWRRTFGPQLPEYHCGEFASESGMHSSFAGPICHAACMHLGAHIPNLFFVESVRAFYRSYFPILSTMEVAVSNGHLPVPAGPGLGVTLRETALARPDLTRTLSEGEGLAQGRRAMGDHWAVEAIR